MATPKPFDDDLVKLHPNSKVRVTRRIVQPEPARPNYGRLIASRGTVLTRREAEERGIPADALEPYSRQPGTREYVDEQGRLRMQPLDNSSFVVPVDHTGHKFRENARRIQEQQDRKRREQA